MTIGGLPASADPVVPLLFDVCDVPTNSTTLLGFDGPTAVTDLVIPAVVPGETCSVTAVAAGAFAREQLESVSVPSSVTTIGPGAFSGNNLTQVTFQDAATVEAGAFEFQGSSAETIWYTDADLTSPTRWDGTVPGPLSLYRAERPVQFDPTRGGSVHIVNVDHGGTVPLPSDPTATGYTFGGWEAASDGHLWDFATEPVFAPTVLQARWIITRYQIAFYRNDDVATRPALSISIAHGGSASAPTLAPRDGYTFLNQWNTQPDGSGALWDPAVAFTSDWTLYAQWRLNSHLISFDLNGGTGSVPSQTVDYGRQVTKPGNPARAGYVFAGWFTADGAPWRFGADSVTGDLQLVAHWSADPTKPPQSDSDSPGDKNNAKPDAPSAGDHTFWWVPDPTITPGLGCKAFSDVKAQHVHCTNIGWLAERGLAKGYSDGSYGADRAVTRGAMVTFLYRMMNPGVPAPACTAKPFRDVEITSEFCGTIQWAKKAGLTYGYADGTFRPAADLTRGAMSAFLYRISNPGQKAPTCTDKPFQDVEGTSEFCGTIDWAKTTGTTFGESSGTYNVTNHTTRGSMATFLHRVAARLW